MSKNGPAKVEALRWANLVVLALTGRSLLRNRKNASLDYSPRRFSQRGRMTPIEMAKRNQILKMRCHIFAA